MAVSQEYRAWVLELLGRVGPVTARAMFGAVGLYLDGLMFALIDDDSVYFKTDDATRPDFEAAGSRPFRPFGDARPMPYYELPADVLEDPDQLRSWTERAVAVARRSKGKKR
jgi:DNA transformation protein